MCKMYSKAVRMDGLGAYWNCLQIANGQAGEATVPVLCQTPPCSPRPCEAGRACCLGAGARRSSCRLREQSRHCRQCCLAALPPGVQKGRAARVPRHWRLSRVDARRKPRCCCCANVHRLGAETGARARGAEARRAGNDEALGNDEERGENQAAEKISPIANSQGQ